MLGLKLRKVLGLKPRKVLDLKPYLIAVPGAVPGMAAVELQLILGTRFCEGCKGCCDQPRTLPRPASIFALAY